jgi:glutamine synthetase
VTDSLHSL